MIEIWNWLIHIPEYLADFGNWLITPIGNGISWAPLAIIGSSMGVALVFIIGLHVVHLVSPLG